VNTETLNALTDDVQRLKLSADVLYNAADSDALRDYATALDGRLDIMSLRISMLTVSADRTV